MQSFSRRSGVSCRRRQLVNIFFLKIAIAIYLAGNRELKKMTHCSFKLLCFTLTNCQMTILWEFQSILPFCSQTPVLCESLRYSNIVQNFKSRYGHYKWFLYEMQKALFFMITWTTFTFTHCYIYIYNHVHIE